MTWNRYFDSITQCPYIRSKRWTFVPPESESFVVALTNCTLSVDEMNEHVRQMQPHLIALNLETVPLHPEHPFQLNGKFDRRSPTPGLSFIRHDIAGLRTAPLERAGHYDEWPTDWQKHFPGLEDS